MEALQGVLVAIGIFISWHVGWHFSDWVKWLFSLRFSATDTHLVIEVDTETVKKKLDRLSQAYTAIPKDEEIIRRAQAYVNTTDMPLSDDIRSYYHYYPEGVEKELVEIHKQYTDNLKYLKVH